MKQQLRSIYWRLKESIAPGVISSQVGYAQALQSALQSFPRWLDLGCGHQFLPDWAWIPSQSLLSSLPRIVGVDGDLASLRRHALLEHRVLADLQALPFRTASFDLITANMVIEHLQHPERLLQEVNRILTPTGRFLFHTPNFSSPLIRMAAATPQGLKNWVIGFLEDRAEADIYPTVYRMNTPRRITELAAAAGFQVESCRLLVSEAATQTLGPLAIFELLYIRMTQSGRFAGLRPDIIATLSKASLSG